MSNEQRAHDLAMFYIKTTTDLKIKAKLNNVKYSECDAINITIDIDEYVNIYNSILNQLNTQTEL